MLHPHTIVTCVKTAVDGTVIVPEVFSDVKMTFKLLRKYSYVMKLTCNGEFVRKLNLTYNYMPYHCQKVRQFQVNFVVQTVTLFKSCTHAHPCMCTRVCRVATDFSLRQATHLKPGKWVFLDYNGH